MLRKGNQHVYILTTDLFHLKNRVLRAIINCLISAGITAALILIVWFSGIPNPNLILMTGLVVITVLLGFLPGAIPTASMVIYSFWFFSTNHDFVSYTEINITKIIVTIVTGILCYAFVGIINLFYVKNTTRLVQTNAELNRDNEHLNRMSKIDALTGTKNRFSLRHDFPGFVGKDLQLMIFDVDDFKGTNDRLGHHAGDEVLVSVSNVTKDIFTDECVYRYGGDEFVVIKTDCTLNEFRALVEKLQSTVKQIEFEGKVINVHLSIGYTYGVPEQIEELRSMIKFADGLMYEVKSSSKNDALGRKFEIEL